MATLRLVCRNCLAIDKIPGAFPSGTLWQALSSSARPVQAKYKTPGRRTESNHLPKQVWNLPKRVQSVLRRDVLRGTGFEETLFRSPYPLIHNATQQKLVNNFFTLDKANKLEFLLQMNSKNLELFLGELAISGNAELHSEDYKVLSEVGISNLATGNLIERLRLTDLLYSCGALTADYVKVFLQHMNLEWPSPLLDTSKLMQLLFYIGIFRNVPPTLIGKIEAYLLSQVNKGDALSHLTTSQIGLVCHAFFATNSAIKSYGLIEAIAQRVLSAKDFERTELYLISNVMKAMHHAGYKNSGFYESVGLMLCKSDMINRDTQMSNLSNIVTAFASVGYSHDKLFENVCNAAEEMVLHHRNQRHRMKDLSRIVMSCHKLRLPVSEVLVRELRRQLQHDTTLRELHPQAFIEALITLSVSDICLFDQLDYIFSPHVTSMIANQDFQRIQLDTMVQLECPEYTGRRLPKEEVMKFVNSRDATRGLALHSRQGLASTWMTLEELLGGPEYVKCHYITSFTRVPDLEMRLDRQGSVVRWNDQPDMSGEERQLRELVAQRLRRVQEVEQEQGVMAELLREHNRHIPIRKSAPNQHFWAEPCLSTVNSTRVTVKVLSENQYVSNKPLLLGIHQLEVRVLNKMGYHVMLLCPYDATRIDEACPAERCALVASLILEPIRQSLREYYKVAQKNLHPLKEQAKCE